MFEEKKYNNKMSKTYEVFSQSRHIWTKNANQSTW